MKGRRKEGGGGGGGGRRRGGQLLHVHTYKDKKFTVIGKKALLNLNSGL